MSWASFGVLNALCHYVSHALKPIFLVLTTTIASVDEPRVSGRLLQLPRVEAIITIAFDRWINIRHSGLFSYVRLGVEI